MKKWIILLIVIIIASGGIFAIYKTLNKTDITYTTAKVVRGNIIQTVSETGNVKAANEIDLSFLNSGKISNIYFAIGDKVKAGDLIAELDYTNLVINKNEAQANLEVAEENLKKLVAGTVKEEIAITKANNQQAKIAYEAANIELEKIKQTANENIAQTRKTLSDLELDTADDLTTYEQAIITAKANLNNAKSTYQKAIDNKKDVAILSIENELAKGKTALDTIDRTINDADGKDLISVKSLTYLINTKDDRIAAIDLISLAEADLTVAKSNQDNVKVINSLISALSAINKVFSALQNCFTALENSVVSAAFTQTELDALKTNISTQKTTIATSISSLQTAEHNLDDAILDYQTNINSSENSLAQAQASYNNAVIAAKNALATAQTSGEQQIAIYQSKANNAFEAWRVTQAQLNKVLAPANEYDVSLAKAKIKQAQASLDAINNQIENSLLRSPIIGTITKKNYDIGEQFSMGGKPVVSILGENNFEIEVLISEADIAKININDNAEITLDSFGEDIKFIGKIVFIEPAETEVQEVIYYKVKVNFDAQDKNVKSGMTANVIITTARQDNVLIIPSRAIIEKNSHGKFIRILVNNQIQEKEIVVGMRGDEGLVELISGLNEGEEVVTYVK